MDEKEKEIISLHALLYDYLMGIHEKDPNFRFQVRQKPRGERTFENGYHFNGNSDYLETSFWGGVKGVNTTPIIRLVYTFKNKAWACELIGRVKDKDDNTRKEYFSKMVEALKDLDFINENEARATWKKELSDKNDFLATLHDFIKKDRKTIDNYLINNPKTEVVDFISEAKFKSNLKKIIHKNRIPNKKIELLVDDYLLESEKKRVSTLPYALETLFIKNFQGINEIALDNSMEISTAQWVFFTGENGFGKTSILRAIALGLIGDEIGTDSKPIIKTDTELRVSGFVNSESFLNNVQPKVIFKSGFKLATYGVARFSTDKNGSKSDASDLNSYSLFKDDGSLKNIQDTLIKDFAYNKTRFEKIKKILCKVVPGIKDIVIDASNGNAKVLYKEQDETANTYKETIELDQLAAGYRSILTMIGDMVIRLSDNLTTSIDDISGVVIIDEVDAHLHPKYQYELPKLLSEVFPNVQFIVSTHSPIPILGLHQDVKSVVLTVNRTVENGITVERLDDDIDIKRLSANALLTSDIFGFPNIFARGATPKTIEPEDNYKEIEEMSRMEKLLKLKKFHELKNK